MQAPNFPLPPPAKKRDLLIAHVTAAVIQAHPLWGAKHIAFHTAEIVKAVLEEVRD